MLDAPIVTTRINALLAALALAVVAALAAGAAGYRLGHKTAQAAGDAALSKHQAATAIRERQAAEAALARYQAAQARGDALEARLAMAESTRQSLAQEHAREIKRLTTGRLCLNAGTVRLLNQPAIGLRPPALPASAGWPAAADGAVATDTDVAGWVDLARRRYDTCRERLDALIDWHGPIGEAD